MCIALNFSANDLFAIGRNIASSKFLSDKPRRNLIKLSVLFQTNQAKKGVSLICLKQYTAFLVLLIPEMLQLCKESAGSGQCTPLLLL